ncbi:IS66 family insertion sequence element accessory protein TnpB [Rhizobium ruizarguesonis]|uniref:IS66 family insertion sequence element accessory protein TnpB n=1 Tax=Rhizobium ruizarguesonis TaxID=2081791 RepID=UPI0013DEBEEB|nr:IS66 family insertion sequence element accessory protein TnpB [Rhizobium ruizarguesonis]QSZ05622.1 IS66 family insertion sequence element accessory protein TnpB [Rhizobium ruizarguesonis]
MIPSGVKVFLASHPIDFRKGPDSLLSLVRDAGSDPFNGALYVFRAKRADRVKIVWWDGSGVCLSSAGPGSAIIASSSIMPSFWLWSTEWTGSGFDPRR